MPSAADALRAFVHVPARPRRSWSAAELTLIRGGVGRYGVVELAEQLGRPAAHVRCKLTRMGYVVQREVNEAVGLSALELARRNGYHYGTLIQRISRGEVEATRPRGAKDFIIRHAAAERFEGWWLEYQAQHAEMLDALAGQRIDKQMFMRLTGLSETHAHRYLAGGVVDAVKVPLPYMPTQPERWEWSIRRGEARRIRLARERGTLDLDAAKGYRARVSREGARIRELRHAQRLGAPEPLEVGKSRYHPGCFTVLQVAKHVSLSAQQVYEHIQRGRLLAVSVMSGGRPRYGVPQDGLDAYVAWCRREVKATGPIANPFRLDQAAATRRGLLTISEAAARAGMTPEALRYRVKTGAVPACRVGRLISIRPEVVLALSQAI